jgi:hypothetical protein
MQVYQAIADAIARLARAKEYPESYLSKVRAESASDTLRHIEREILPSGSGFDCGTTIDLDESDPEKIVLRVNYHHITENGFYDGWTYHRVILTPAFDGFYLRVTGKNRNGISEFIERLFYDLLSEDYRESD